MGRRGRKLWEISSMVLSLMAIAAINYSIVHSVIVFLALAVLLAHELGHYIIAHREHANPRLPFFIPLPFIMIAATKVQHTTRHTTRKIALAGPCAGALTALLLLVIAIVSGANVELITALVILLISEIVVNFVGSDGKRFRTA